MRKLCVACAAVVICLLMALCYWVASLEDPVVPCAAPSGDRPGSPPACAPDHPATAAASAPRSTRVEPVGPPRPARGQRPRGKPVDAEPRLAIRAVHAATGECFARTSLKIDSAPLETDAAGWVFVKRQNWFHVSIEGFAPSRVDVRCNDGSWPDTIVVPLYPSATLAGAVVDTAGAPVAGVEVCAWGKSEEKNPPNKVEVRPVCPEDAVTDAAGRFRLGSVPAGVPIGSRAGGGLIQVTHNLPALEPGEIRSVRLTLPAWGAVHGEVVDQDQLRVPFAQVALLIENSNQEQAFLQTDSAGLFRFEGIPLGAYRVKASPRREDRRHPTSFPPGEIAVELVGHGTVATASVRVDRGLFLRGIVVGPDGEPVPDALVERSPGAVLPEESGPAIVRAGSAWQGKPSWSDALYGRPWVRRGVTFNRRDRFAESARTGPDGTFAIGPVNSGTYELLAEAKEVYRTSELVRAEAGGASVTLRVPLGGCLEGRVVPTRGERAATGGRLWAVRHGSADAIRSRFFVVGRSDEEKFSLAGLEPGRYELFLLPWENVERRPEPSDELCGPVDGVMVERGTRLRNLRIPFLPAGTIRVHVTPCGPADIHLGPMFVFRVMVDEATIAAVTVSSSRRPSFLVLPPRTYRIRVHRWSSEKKVQRDELLTVVAGQEVAVRLP
ncbi:MAG: hypothetical protein JXQ29_15170 [Planctomycetes bacterium]|nr:hypothetical protein [Planctomycetota bacterium]